MIGDEDVTDFDPSERGVAMVFQSYALYPHMTVEQNIGFGLRMGGMPRDQVATRVDEAARILELDGPARRKPRQLSGGQRQRVAIGRAIVRKPKAFLFDEPLSNLDAELRVQMRIEIAKLHQRLGATMIYVTHDQVEAMTLADRIVVLRAGVSSSRARRSSSTTIPTIMFVAGFIGSPRDEFPAGRDRRRIGGRQAEVRLTDFGGNDAYRPHTHRSRQGRRQGVARHSARALRRCRRRARSRSRRRAQVVEQLGGVSYVYAGEGGAQLTVQQKGHSSIPTDSRSISASIRRVCLLFDADGKRLWCAL